MTAPCTISRDLHCTGILRSPEKIDICRKCVGDVQCMWVLMYVRDTGLGVAVLELVP